MDQLQGYIKKNEREKETVVFVNEMVKIFRDQLKMRDKADDNFTLN